MNKNNKKQKTIAVVIICIIIGIIIYFYLNNNIKINNKEEIEEISTYEEDISKEEKQISETKNNDENNITNNNNNNNNNNNKENKENAENIENEIIIHITGAIKNEGVYKLKSQSRVSDAVEIAGGLREDADTKKINLAYLLEDGMKIIIPSINDKETEEELITKEIGTNNSQESVKDESQNSKKININTASEEELDQLPGIGKTTAKKIIEYRNENGKFSNIEEIKNVKGIGESKFKEIEDMIFV